VLASTALPANADEAATAGTTALSWAVYGLFVLCALALGTLTVGVLYLSFESWRNKTEEKKSLMEYDRNPSYAAAQWACT
jgi:hypothetical protein